MPDPALLSELLQEEGIVTTPVEATRSAWLSEVLAHAWKSFTEGLRQEGVWGWVAMGVLTTLAFSLLGFFLWILWKWLLGKRPKEVVGVAEKVRAEPRLEKAAVLALLAEGRRREAARLAWIWLVEGLSAAGIGEAKADQTHGEFVRSVRRKDPGSRLGEELGTLSGEADRLCYAETEPTKEGVERWVMAAERLRSGEAA